jgi:hypothetical protein
MAACSEANQAARLFAVARPKRGELEEPEREYPEDRLEAKAGAPRLPLARWALAMFFAPGPP